MKFYIEGIKKYAVFKGRESRKSFWMFYLFNLLVSLILTGVDNLLGLANDVNYTGPFFSIYIILVFLPMIGMMVRRLHDVNKSGKWILVQFIPVVGTIWLILLLARQGETTANRHGPEPILE